MTYYYQIQAYSYSDFETWEISHEKKFMEDEFKEICKEAKNKLKNTNMSHWDAVENIIAILGQQYGFKKVKYTADVHVEDL